jgi:hypothetical protein
MPIYFAYGSNMSSARLFARIGTVRPLGAVHVIDWQLCFDKPGRDGTGKANLIRAVGSRVWGVAYELPESVWPVLDRFEPGYRRRTVSLEHLSGPTMEAHTYRHDPVRGAPRLIPSGEYVGHLVAGALEHGLPVDYIETLRAIATLRADERDA